MELINLVLHLDKYIATAVATYHNYFYLIIFLTIFSETGLVVAPFLPGDSLLFMSGSLAGTGSLNSYILAITIFLAALSGDNCNFFIGRTLGINLFKNPKSKIFRQDILKKTHDFYERHGTSTIIIARFIPLMRTFAPFVAGIAQMKYVRFISFSLIGTFLWVTIFLGGGILFGNLPIIKNHLSLIIVVVMFISIIPMLVTIVREMRRK